MLRKFLVVACLMLIFGGGCHEPTATPIAMVQLSSPTGTSTSQPIATHTSIPRPTATKTLKPRPTLKPVGELTQQAEAQADFYTLTPSRTPTPTPTVTPTPTPIPVAPLVAHEWLAEPVLLQFGTFGGDGGPELPRVLHEFVLYADGRLIISKWDQSADSWPWHGQLLERTLSQHEVCALLNTIDQTGFFDYDPNRYLPEGKYFPFDGSSSTLIDVNAWRKKQVDLYGLWHFVEQEPPLTWEADACQYCAPPPFIASALSQTYRLLSRYQPGKFNLYIPERLGVWIELNELPAADSDQPWPLKSPALSEIYARTVDNGEMYGRSIVIAGDEAVSVYQVFDNTFVDSIEGDRVFVEDGQRYSVFVRPLFPYESTPKYRGDVGLLPDPSISKPAVRLACTPRDGMLPIPCPSIAAMLVSSLIRQFLNQPLDWPVLREMECFQFHNTVSTTRYSTTPAKNG